jgi:two-component system sensor histidine kinase PilS (NtrC family)
MSQDLLLRRLKSLVAFRVFFVTALLGSFFYFRIGLGHFPYPSIILYLIAFLYAVSIGSALAIGRVPSVPLAYVQLVLDVLAACALILITGGIESWFSWLLLLIVMSSAIILNKKAAFFIATVSAILYGTLIDLQFYQIIPIQYYEAFQEKDFLYRIFSHILGLYLIAYLTGRLTEMVEKQTIDFEKLALFNQTVIDSTPSGLFTTGMEGRIEVFNRAAEAITGITPSDAEGQHVSSIFPFLPEIKGIKRTEARVSYGSDTKIIGLDVSTLLDQDGKATGYICVFQDLTELKQMAKKVKQKEELAAIGELSAKIAHEIRNPLASLKGSIEMLSESKVGQEKKDRLMHIALSEMDRLNSIITEFLNYSRPRPLYLQSFDLHTELAETVEMFNARVDLNARIDGLFEGELNVMADAEKLREVFWNLGINALESMTDGGTLTISTLREGDNVFIRFSDTGSGIDREDIDRIFFPFFTTKKSGTGLGLSISYRVAQDHGGSIKVESSPGEGATFTVILPVEL